MPRWVPDGPLLSCVRIDVQRRHADLAQRGYDAFFLAVAAIEQTQQTPAMDGAGCPPEAIPDGAFAFVADKGAAKMRAEPAILVGFLVREDSVPSRHGTLG